MTRAVLALALLLTSCGGSATAPVTPAPPNSPQTQTLNVTKALADAINAAVKTAITLRDQGQISASDTRTVENWAKSATILDDQIATELGNTSDPWPTQKAKILLLLPGFQFPFGGSTNTTLQAAITAVGTTVNLIRTQVQQ